LVPFREPFIIRWLIQQLQPDDIWDTGEVFGEKFESQCGGLQILVAVPEIDFASADAAVICKG
jgi:hypothetical protein